MLGTRVCVDPPSDVHQLQRGAEDVMDGAGWLLQSEKETQSVLLFIQPAHKAFTPPYFALHMEEGSRSFAV